MNQPTLTINLDVEIDYGQLYIYSQPPDDSDPDPDNHAVLRAFNDAWGTHRFVGVADGLIDLVTPVQWNFHAPMRVEVWPTEPPSDEDNWDHVVDVDFDVTNDQVIFEGSGGRPPIRSDEPVPSGTYRARISGRGYTEAETGAEGMDSYRLQLWPRTGSAAPQLRKSWPGWKRKIG